MAQPGVIFYAETAEQYYNLRDLAKDLRNAGIDVIEGHDNDRGTPCFEVYAHGNTVAPFLANLQKS